MLIGLAFGSMAGDALLHLIPNILGLHAHDENDDKHSDHVHHDNTIIWLMFSVLVAIYLLYLFEMISNAIAHIKVCSTKLLNNLFNNFLCYRINLTKIKMNITYLIKNIRIFIGKFCKIKIVATQTPN